MRAAVLQGGRIEVRETARPDARVGTVLVRSLACGICASDIHFMDHPEGDADDDSGLSNYDADADIVMGHEYCAEVVDYGPGTQRKWPIGTRVSSIPALLVPDGVRIIGQSPDAPGGFGEYFLLTEGMTQVVPSDLPERAGVDRRRHLGGLVLREAGRGDVPGGAAGHRVRRHRSLGGGVVEAPGHRADRRR